MKCIVRKSIVRKAGIVLLLVFLAMPAGCGNKIEPEQKYDTFKTTEEYGIGILRTSENLSFYAKNLCVGGNEDVLNDHVTESISEAAGLFDMQGHTVVYAKNIHERLYPASTTKILTAYVALKYGDLTATATVSADALQLEEGSSVCALSAGDQLTLEQLLYGLMLRSGNDAANVIAETISGSTEAFTKLMNQEALALGATNSSFVNAHGLHSEQHYTTVYDLYLIFQAALQNETFRQIIGTKSYEADYFNRHGAAVSKVWKSTNRYLTGEENAPEGITIIGGKTGTTFDAGNCLVLCSESSDGKPYISIVLKSDGKDNLYFQMSELLKIISN